MKFLSVFLLVHPCPTQEQQGSPSNGGWSTKESRSDPIFRALTALRLRGRKMLWCFSTLPLLRLELASHLKELIKEGNQSPEKRLLQQPGCGAGCKARFCPRYQSQPYAGGADADFSNDTSANRQNKLRRFLKTICRSGRPAFFPILPLNLAAFNP